jgi:predicted porin
MHRNFNILDTSTAQWDVSEWSVQSSRAPVGLATQTDARHTRRITYDKQDSSGYSDKARCYPPRQPPVAQDNRTNRTQRGDFDRGGCGYYNGLTDSDTRRTRCAGLQAGC